MAVPKNSGGLTTPMLVCFRTVIFLLVANYECVGAIFMWTSPPPAWNQTVTGTGGARTVVIQVRNGTTDYPLRWNYTLLTGQTITITNFVVGISPSQPVDIGFVVNPGGVGESTVINNLNDFQTRFRLQSDKKSSTLTIIKVNEREKATFQCKVQVGANQYAYNVRIEVTVPPGITYISSNENVTEGQNVTLICTPSGYPAPNITWTRLSDNSTVTMPLINISRQYEGGYRCTVDNGVGSPATRDTYIIVHYDPENVTLSKDSSSDKVCVGSMVQFTCKAGAANPEVERYTLHRNGTVIANMSSSGVSTLWLNTTGLFIYKCVAENSVGTGTSNSIIVTVEGRFSVTNVTVSPKKEVEEGENVTLFCNVTGGPARKVVWVDASNKVTNRGATWPLPNISRSRNGTYSCVASNACGEGSKTTTIVVQYAPENVTLSKDSSSDKVCVGKMVRFTCKAGAANPEVDNYTLYQNNNVIANMNSSGVFTLWLNTTGIFIYKCEANNSVGTGTSNSISVTVEGPFSVISVSPTTVVEEGDSVILFCNVIGDPAPNVSWVDASNQVPNSSFTLPLLNISRNGTYSGSTWPLLLNISQNGTYSCVASNACGEDNKTTTIVVQSVEEKENPSSEGVTWRITLIITNAECNEEDLVERIRGEVKKVLAGLGLTNVNVTVSCGSVIVDLILQFSRTVSESVVIDTLKKAARKDQFGEFKVDPDSIKRTPDGKQGPDCEETFFRDTNCSIKLAVAIGISVAAVFLIVIITSAVGYWIHKKRKCRKDTRIAHEPGCEEQRLQGDDPYAQVNNGYAETGPRSVNSREKAAAAVPDYAVVDKSAKKKKKKQDEEKPSEYAVVDKSKKKKKNEKGDDTYAKVDMSKKTSKKKPRPGEDMLYADLGDFSGTSQMPTVATSPKAQAQLPPIKRPEPYEGTQYADITQFLKGDATLPIDDKQGGQQGAELKEKEGKTDGAGGENAPKETPM